MTGERRKFIGEISIGIATLSLCGCQGMHGLLFRHKDEGVNQLTEPLPTPPNVKLALDGLRPVIQPPEEAEFPGGLHTAANPELKRRLLKSRHFNRDYPEDIWIPTSQMPLLKSTARKLYQVRKVLGYGHFNLVSFDEMNRFCRNSPRLQPFTPEELSFLDQMFHFDASNYGFFGDKVTTQLTAAIDRNSTVKIPGSGHYLFRGQPHNTFQRIRREFGRKIILTSGIRGVVKQLQLFLAKAVAEKGNLSRASRSLAPPGHSYHGIGDFDVGKPGLGAENFTSIFASTPEYERLQRLGFIDIRYPQDNPFGVRYEPWHVKI